MHRILFICHGNICRSTMAQFVMEYLASCAGRAADFAIDSAATSTEEIGMPPHPGTVRTLRGKGVPVGKHRARQVRREEYGDWDAFVYMDAENERGLKRIFRDDPEGKCVKLLAYRGCSEGESPSSSESAPDVADPWYTGDFEATYRDVLAGCEGILRSFARDAASKNEQMC